MTQFDALLRQALMDANLAQYQRILQQVETEAPDFSPQYHRERMRFLANPWNWGKKQARPILRRGISRGIAVAIAVLLLATAAVAERERKRLPTAFCPRRWNTTALPSRP